MPQGLFGAKSTRKGVTMRRRNGRSWRCCAVLIALLPLRSPTTTYYASAPGRLNAIGCIGLEPRRLRRARSAWAMPGFSASAPMAARSRTARCGLHPRARRPVGAAAYRGALAALVGRPILRLKGHYLGGGDARSGRDRHDGPHERDQSDRGPGRHVAWPNSDCAPAARYGSADLGGVLVLVRRRVLLIAAWLALNLVKSPAGRALRALHGSETAAEMVGIDVSQAKVMVFVMSAVLPRVAGSLTAH